MLCLAPPWVGPLYTNGIADSTRPRIMGLWGTPRTRMADQRTPSPPSTLVHRSRGSPSAPRRPLNFTLGTVEMESSGNSDEMIAVRVDRRSVVVPGVFDDMT